jgi:hypothetical protein
MNGTTTVPDKVTYALHNGNEYVETRTKFAEISGKKKEFTKYGPDGNTIINETYRPDGNIMKGVKYHPNGYIDTTGNHGMSNNYTSRRRGTAQNQITMDARAGGRVVPPVMSGRGKKAPTCIELKKLCREKGLPVGGKKAVLLRRLKL